MKILIDIGHPAHVHIFKHLAWELSSIGHEVIFSVRSGENEASLLQRYGFNYHVIGRKKRAKLGKILGLITFTIKILLLSRLNKSDLYISHGSMYAGYAAFLRKKPHIALEDSGNMEQLRLSIPVSSVILSPDVLNIDLGRKHLKYKGYHELTYLSPRYFEPDPDIKLLLGLTQQESYCILRFSGWRASHDDQQNGLSEKDKEKIIKFLENYLRVFISSENQSSNNLSKYEFSLHPDKLHDAIAGAEIIISEGATIAAEAGVLGVPSIYVNSIERCYNEDLERYGLVYNFRRPTGVLDKIKEILNTPDYKSLYQSRRKKMLQEKIDVTAFLAWFVENYPKSSDILRINPDYQLRFR